MSDTLEPTYGVTYSRRATLPTAEAPKTKKGLDYMQAPESLNRMSLAQLKARQ